MPYFERPNMVKNALDSFLEIDYDNYEICIIDDGSKKNPIYSVLTNEHYKNIKNLKILYTHDSIENKLQRGSIHGSFMNKAILESNAEIVVMMSDDDAVTSNYFKDLNNFYNINTKIQYSYCHIIPFDPMVEKPSKNLLNKTHTIPWNTNAATNLNHTIPLNPYCRVDSTQVSWRRSANIDDKIFFPEEQTKNLDASFYSKMYETYGSCFFNGIIGMYKGFHHGQLGNRSGVEQFDPIDIINTEN